MYPENTKGTLVIVGSMNKGNDISWFLIIIAYKVLKYFW